MKKSGVLASEHILRWEMQDRNGCWNCSTLIVMAAILKPILWRTGSQHRSERTFVMRHNRGLWATTRARVLWTSWRRVRFETRRSETGLPSGSSSMRTCSIDSPDNIAQSDTYVVPDGPIDPYPVVRQRILRQDYAHRLLPSSAFHENCVSSEQLQFVHFSLKI